MKTIMKTKETDKKVEWDQKIVNEVKKHCMRGGAGLYWTHDAEVELKKQLKEVISKGSKTYLKEMVKVKKDLKSVSKYTDNLNISLGK